MNTLQRTLLSFGIIIIVSMIIYFLIVFFRKSNEKMRHNKMLTMNLVIKYNPFLEYLNYQIENKESFYIYLIKINNFNLLENKFNDKIIKSYLSMIAKELSVYLPFGGKVAQTNTRDSFIIYYPVTSEDPVLVGERFKSLATKTYHRSGIHISKTNSVASVNNDDFTLQNLNSAMINSLRQLGELSFYESSMNYNYNDYINTVEKIHKSIIDIKSFNVKKVNDPVYKEVYNELLIDGLNIKKYLLNYSVNDQSWINIYLIEHLLNSLYDNNIFSNINIPVLFKTMENDLFVEVIEKLVMDNKFLLEQVIISIKESNVEFEEKVIKNILSLSNIGMKFSLEIENLTPATYTNIQKYNINRIEINESIMNHQNISELLYFAKVNYLEVIYKTNKTIDNINDLNVSHVTGEAIKIEQGNKGKRGRK